MIGWMLWILALLPPVHRWTAPVAQVRLQAQLQGVVCIVQAGQRLEIVGDTAEFALQGDTLKVQLRHRVQSWLARWGWALDTVVIRIPPETPVTVDFQQQGGWWILRGQGLRLQGVRGRLHRVQALLHLQGGQVWLRGAWSQIRVFPDPHHPPQYLELQVQWSRVTLDLRRPPVREVPVVLAAQFSWIYLQTNGAPVAATRQGLLNLGPLPQDPRSPGYRLLLSGNVNRISVVPAQGPAESPKEVHP